ncbi:MAG TPA: hypothetical protein VGG41_18035 [Solirubrobacteraceae bacterium]|jgi:hypothetical protein
MAQKPSPFAAWGQGSVAAPAPPLPAAPDPSDTGRVPSAFAAHHHLEVGATLPRMILCAALAAGLAAAIVLALGGSSAPAPLKLLRGATFTTVVPAGFVATVSYPLPGFQKFQLSNGVGLSALPLSNTSVPAPGTIELTVSEVPVSVASSASHEPDLATLPPRALVGLVVKLPAGARDVVTAGRLRATTLAGQSAAAITYAYTYQGVANVQSDLVTRRGQQLLGIEFNSQPSLHTRAVVAELTLLEHWSWTSPVVG